MSVGLFNAVALAYVLLLHAPATVVPKPGEVEAVASIKQKCLKIISNGLFVHYFIT